MHDLMKRFVTALGELHENRDVDPLVELFSDDATLTKAGIPHGQHGKDGARTFWQQYRDVFDSIEATFRHTEDGERTAFLEWTSTGTLRDGTDFAYDGVSVLESDGDTIDAFRTYYDTAAFLSAEKRRALGA
ncbi:nuclear transport factor 2 family protein [Mycobacterium sp. PS03-16]|nr:nuclear transport factor 2 family protein [Mycobacterium sp. PS03-16]